MKRTTRGFALPDNFWPIVNAWTAQNGYHARPDQDPSHTFQKGVGFWVAPMMLKMRVSGDAVELEAWIRAGLFVRICSLFILPAEMGIESGGFRGVLPRKIARGALNQLLAQLGQPGIP